MDDSHPKHEEPLNHLMPPVLGFFCQNLVSHPVMVA